MFLKFSITSPSWQTEHFFLFFLFFNNYLSFHVLDFSATAYYTIIDRQLDQIQYNNLKSALIGQVRGKFQIGQSCSPNAFRGVSTGKVDSKLFTWSIRQLPLSSRAIMRQFRVTSRQRSRLRDNLQILVPPF